MFEWADFLNVARELGSSEEEASLRTAVGRAYYSAFHAACRYVRNQGVNLPRHGAAHEEVLKALESGKRHEKAAALQLRRLKKSRTEADYELAPPTNWAAQCKSSLVVAESVISKLEPIITSGS